MTSPGDSTASRKVALTGCGLVTPAGNGLGEFWANVMAGQCQIRLHTDLTFPDAGEVYAAVSSLPGQERMPTTGEAGYRTRCVDLARAAMASAVSNAGLAGAEDLLADASLCVATVLGEEREIGDFCELQHDGGGKILDGRLLERGNNHRIGSVLAGEHGIEGPVQLLATACSSGIAAVGMAYDQIAQGDRAIAIAGGADTLTRLTYCGFRRMGALSKSICRPFDRTRDGVSFGEGAGFVVLEDLEHARQRGAHIHAVLSGYGVSSDAYHISAPAPDGEGFVRAIKDALERSGVSADRVGYVSAHGTGTEYNDIGECRAVQTVFGAREPRIAMSSLKSMLGHTNGAASVIETVLCALALKHQAVPPTARLQEPEPGFDIDFVPQTGKSLPLQACLNLAAGFGGFNVCLVVEGAP